MKDYKFYDTKPAFSVGKPKIRFVNLNFFKQNLKLSVGEGKLIKENLQYRQLTAYEEAPEFLYEKTSFTIIDSTGAVVLQDTISIATGNNYTLYILPAYKGRFTDYKVPFDAQTRYMSSYRSDKVDFALISDPGSTSLADRVSVRQVTFSPPIITNKSNVPYFTQAEQDPFKLEFTGSSSNYAKSFTFIPEPTINKIPDFASGKSFTNFGYAVATPGNYIFYWGGVTGVPQATKVGNSPNDGKTLTLSANHPFSFQAGKSYTVITNGTLGEGNDVENADDVIPKTANVTVNGIPGLSVPNALKLKAIPYESFILEDGDGSARTLIPLPLNRISRQVAIVNFIDMNYLWKASNPSNKLQLSISGLIPPSGQIYYDDGRLLNIEYLPSETKQFGNQKIEVVPLGISRPIISSTDATLAPNGKYFAFHYVDKDNTSKLKVIQADTLVSYNSPVRVNFANFSPDLEPVAIKNAETGQIIIPEIKFTELSSSIDLPVERSFIGTVVVYEHVPKLLVVKPSTGEVLFELVLSSDDSKGVSLLFNISQGQSNSAIIYTVIFSGKYSSVSGIDKFEKRIFTFKRADRPTFNYENVYDWQLSYGILP